MRYRAEHIAIERAIVQRLSDQGGIGAGRG